MKRISPFIAVALLSLALFATPAFGQQEGQPAEPDKLAAPGTRPNLLEALGLTRDQIRQIREMNRDRKPLMEAAQLRLRNANRDLDISIYGDSLDENDVAAKLREFQAAQADVARLRFQSELSLRKILDAEQLAKFRELRARAARTRDARRVRPDRRPLRRLRQLPNKDRETQPRSRP